MANRIYQKLALATAGTVLSLAVMETPSVQAAIITYDFTVNLTGDFQGNSYTGFFSYNDSEPSGVSTLLYPYFAPSDFSFDLFGKSYKDLRLSDKSLRIPPFSYLRFTSSRLVINNNPMYLVPEGELKEVEFLLTDVSPAGGSYIINFYSNSSFFFWFFDRFPQNTISLGGGNWTYKLREEAPSTSVPEPGTVFGLSMLGFGWLLRKKKASSHA